MTRPWMIYGATGYTGQLIARRAIAAGSSIVLGGRTEATLRPLAEELGCEYRVARLDDPDLAGQLTGLGAVCHVAGPFSATARPMIDACLRARCHYLDLATELDVFEGARQRDAEARAVGVALIPGAGFDVTVADCLALGLQQRVPSASRLFFAFDFGRTRHSSGATLMGVEALAQGTMVRRDDRLVRIASGSRRRRIASPDGEWDAAALPFPFGDLVTARHSTGIGNIEIQVKAPPWRARLLHALSWLEPALARPWLQRALAWLVTRWPARTDSVAERARIRTRVYAEISDDRSTHAAEVVTPHSYDVTAETAVRIADRLSAGDHAAGFLTPAQLLGAGFLANLSGVRMTTWEAAR
jgi:short subunit dehydrogenase-like uncharacterized protein